MKARYNCDVMSSLFQFIDKLSFSVMAAPNLGRKGGKGRRGGGREREERRGRSGRRGRGSLTFLPKLGIAITENE